VEVSRTDGGLFNLPARFVSASGEETAAIGERCAALLSSGSIVALEGPLGAGKTCFSQGVARALGVTEPVTSPTYTIVREYQISTAPARAAPFPALLYHIDAYRLNGSDDFYAIGGDEILFSGGISLIEWSVRIEDCIPNGAFVVEIEILNDGTRSISIRIKGDGA